VIQAYYRLLFHISSKFDFFIGVDMVMCHALKKSTSHFSYIMVTSFSGGRSRSTQREPPTWEQWSQSLFDFQILIFLFESNESKGGRCGRDRMVVGFTTTCAITAYHH
jgi:hypothetical protein